MPREMAQAGTSGPALDEGDVLRAQLYALLARLFVRPPDKDLILGVGNIAGDSTPLGEALSRLAAAARAAEVGPLEREYHDLFIGVGRGELVPFGSYYITGFLNEKPLARLRREMAELGIARADGVAEPEDHIASLCEMMAGLIAGAFAVDTGRQQRFFDRHLAPWAPRFFQDLERSRRAGFYAAVGAVGREFMAVEAEAFRLAA